jgi:hypothetical protein
MSGDDNPPLVIARSCAQLAEESAGEQEGGSVAIVRAGVRQTLLWDDATSMP